MKGTGRGALILAKLVESLKRDVKATGAEGVVLGLSGGVDSALAAAVSSAAFGSERVKALFLPYRTSSEESREDAALAAEAFGICLETLDMSEVLDAFIKERSGMTPVRRGNVMARLRMAALFDKAAEISGIVLGTSNKTEILLGYGTWYGDTASSINVLGELYKRDVFETARAAGVPERIVLKAPTADLWPGQTDEKELGFSYREADDFFYAALELGLDKRSLDALFTPGFVSCLSSRVVRNSFKRKLPKICAVYRDDSSLLRADEVFSRLI